MEYNINAEKAVRWKKRVIEEIDEIKTLIDEIIASEDVFLANKNDPIMRTMLDNNLEMYERFDDLKYNLDKLADLIKKNL